MLAVANSYVHVVFWQRVCYLREKKGEGRSRFLTFSLQIKLAGLTPNSRQKRMQNKIMIIVVLALCHREINSVKRNVSLLTLSIHSLKFVALMDKTMYVKLMFKTQMMMCKISPFVETMVEKLKHFLLALTNQDFYVPKVAANMSSGNQI